LKPRFAFVLGAAITSLTATAWLLASHAPDVSPSGRESTASSQSAAKYLGVENCKDCHGKSESQTNKRGTSNQMEYKTWSGSDRHSKAFTDLMEPKTEQIARHLGMRTLPKQWEDPEKPPEEWNRCLNCHSMNFVPEPQRGQKFKLADGVSCDGCHGPAEKWLGPHQDREYAESLKLEMKNIRNPVVRAEMCLSCHLGSHTEGKIVDHAMIAAGHPRLVFELDAFCQKLPPHWQPKEAKDGNLPRAQLWAAGQVVALREAVRLLAEDLKSDRWPEYSHFDCAACHHDLDNSGWRQRRPNPGPPGRPLVQSLHTATVAHVIQGFNSCADLLSNLDTQFSVVAFGRTQQIAASVAQLSKELDELANSAASKPISAAEARQMARDLYVLVEPFAWRGSAAAQQLIYALNALLCQSLPVDAPALMSLKVLAASLESAGDKYDPEAFLKQVHEIGKQIP